MGHYASEFQCDDCGKVRCICEPSPSPPNLNYIVTDDFQVVTVDEFDTDPANYTKRVRYGNFLNNPYVYRMDKKEFKKREDAERHAMELCEMAVERARLHLAELKNVLKVKRPWEKK